MMIPKLSLLFAFCSIGLLAGEIAGSVSDESGAPVPEIEILYRRIPAVEPAPSTTTAVPSRRVVLRAGERFLDGKVATNAQGQYTIRNLPEGFYTLCLASTDTQYLDPCTWRRAVGVQVGATGTSQAEAIVLEKGIPLSFRLNDPNGHLTGRSAVTGIGVAIGVFAKGGEYYGARLVSQKSQQYDFRLLVPRDQLMDVWTHSRDFAVRNEKSLKLIADDGERSPITTMTTAAQTIETFTITGRKR
jgi:hypothetical protein